MKKRYLIFLFIPILLLLSKTTTIQLHDYQSKDIQVELKGEVMHPGVYTLQKTSTIEDVLLLAGGLTKGADLSQINLTATLKHKSVIIIPQVSEIKLISINTASLEELDSLSGIGPSIAQKIIDYREAHQGFSSLEELMQINGIKQKLFDKIKDLICL